MAPDSVDNATDTTTATTDSGTTASTTTAASTDATSTTQDASTSTTTSSTASTDTAQGDKPAGEDATDDASKTGDDKAATGAPEAYTPFTMPEGVELDQAAVDRATPVMKEIGLTQEQAQKLVDFYAPEMQQRVEAGVKATVESPEFLQSVVKGIDDARDAEWIAAVKADPDIGGAKLDETKALALKGVDAFGSPALKEALVQTRMGNHPEFVRLFARIGALVKEDGGGLTPGGGAAPQSLAHRLYPNNP